MFIQNPIDTNRYFVHRQLYGKDAARTLLFGDARAAATTFEASRWMLEALSRDMAQYIDGQFVDDFRGVLETHTKHPTYRLVMGLIYFMVFNQNTDTTWDDAAWAPVKALLEVLEAAETPAAV